MVGATGLPSSRPPFVPRQARDDIAQGGLARDKLLVHSRAITSFPEVFSMFPMVGATGLEPATTCTPCKHSSQLNYAPSFCSITDSGDAGGTKSGACGGVLIQAASAFAGCGSIQGAESCKISCGGKGIEVTFQAYFSSLCTSFVASPLEYCILLNLCYNITIT